MKRIGFEILMVLAGMATVVLFQNCSGDYKVDPQSGGNLVQVSTEHPKVDFGFQDGSTAVAEYQILPGKDYAVAFMGDATNASEFHFSVNSTSNSANCHLSTTAVVTTQTLRCAYAGDSSLTVAVVWKDGTTDTHQKTLKVINSGTATPTPTPGSTAMPVNTIVFSIPAGTTLNGPWNMAATPVVVFVGQNLRIVNNDSATHRLHTNGSPCPHQPADMTTGQYYDCAITAEHLPNANDLYDHNATVGTAAAFYVQALDGAKIYSTAGKANCAVCHGNLPGSTKRGKSAQAITNAIAGVPAMQLQRLKDLTPAEIRAIEFGLK